MAGGLVKTALFNGGLIGDAINVGAGILDYKSAREEGHNVPVSAAKAVGSFAYGEFVYGGIMGVVGKIGLTGGKAIVAGIGASIAFGAITAGTQIASTMGQHTAMTMGSGYGHKGKFGSGYFDMTESGYTMRQRSLNAIRQNGLNTQSVLGNEARTYYRG